MGTVFGANNVANTLQSSSFKNISTKTLILQADTQYVIAPGQVITIPTSAANASVDVQAALALNEIIILNIYTAVGASDIANGTIVPNASAASSGIASLQAASLGGFYGITETSDGYWELSDGNTYLYPNSQSYSQPTAGVSSVVSIGAIMRRTDTTQGNIGFAIYTDGTTSEFTFLNGYVIYWQINGMAIVYKVQNGQPVALASSGQIGYPVNTNWNNFQVTITQTVGGQLSFVVYYGGLVILKALDLSQAFLGGTVGFSTSQGSLPVYVQPDSFAFSVGTDAHETSSLATQSVITPAGTYDANLAANGTILPQNNTDPAVLWGSIDGSNKNMIPDSGVKWGGVFWDFSFAGSMHVVNGVGVTGGNGFVFSAPSGSAIATGELFFKQILPAAVVANTAYTVSGSINASQVVSGSPSWAVYSADLSVKLAEISQVAGATGAMPFQTFTVPATGVASVVITGNTNNCVVAGGGQLIFSGEQIEIGIYKTAYDETVVDDITSYIPYGLVPPSIKNVITQTPGGSGQLNINTAVPGQQLNWNNNTDPVTNTLNQNINLSTGTYLTTNSTSGNNVQSQSISTPQIQALRYSTTSYNVYSDSGTVPASSGLWWLKGVGPLSSSTSILDGSQIIYQISQVDPSTQQAQLDTLKLAAKSSIIVQWQHVPFVGSSVGSTTVTFAGSAVGTVTNAQASQAISGTSGPNINSQAVNTNAAQSFNGTVSNSSQAQISSTTGPVTTLTPYTTTLTNTATGSISFIGTSGIQTANGNNSSSASIVANTTYVPTTTGASYSSTPAITANTQTTPQSSAVNNSSSTSITKTNTVVAASTAVANNSSPNITSSILSNTTTSQLSASANISSSPTITSTNTTSTSNNPFNDGGYSFSSSPSISRTANATTYTATQTTVAEGTTSQSTSITRGSVATYTLTQQTSGYLNNSGASTASITQVAHSSSGSTSISGTSTCPTVTETYTAGHNFPNPDQDVPASDSTSGGGAGNTTSFSLANVTGSLALSLSFSYTNTADASYSVNISVTDGAGNQVYSATSGQISSFSQSFSGVSGTWAVAIHGISSPIDRSANYSVSSAVSYTGSMSATVTTYTYTTSAGTYQLYGTYTGVAPTSSANQIRFHLSNTAYGSDSNGSAAVELLVQKNDGSGTAVIDVSSPTGNTDYTYYNASETCTSYNVYMRAIITSNNSTGSSNYNPNIDGYYYYYTNVPTTYNYTSSNGTAASITTSSSSLASSSSTPVSIALSSVSLPSDSTGSNYFKVTATNGSSTYTASATGNTTLTVPNGWPAGGTTWSVQAMAVVGTTSAASSSYTCSASISCSYYTNVANPTTYTYTNNNGTGYYRNTSSSTLSPTTATPISLQISGLTLPSDANGSSNYNVILYNPAGSSVQTWSNQSTNQTLTYSGGGAAGQWQWYVYGGIATDTGTNTTTYAVTATLTNNWYQSVTTGGITYAANNPAAYYISTSSDTLAPTASSSQLSAVISGISTPSDSNGSTSYTVYLANPSGTTLQTWAGITTNQTLTYSNSSAVGGVYKWYFQAVVSTVNSTGTSTYSDSLTATTYWYHSVTTNTTVYNANSGSAQSYNTGNANAPISSGTQLSFSVTSLTAPSDAQGSSAYHVKLVNPSGTSVPFSYVTGYGTPTSGTDNGTFTASYSQGPITFTYYNSSAVAGVYTWTVQAVATTNNNGTDTYAASLSGTLGWYVTQITYPTTNQTAQTYSTSSSANGGTGSAPITLSISSIAVGSDANGSNSYTVNLYGPASSVTPIQTWTGITTTQSLSYTGGGSVGTYTFAIQAIAAPTNTASSTYSNSLSATLGYYVTSPTGSYSTTNGSVVNYTTGSVIAPAATGTQLSFSIGSISTISNANGASSFNINLLSPSGGSLYSWTNLTTAQTLTYSASGAIAGVYKWSVQAVVSNNQSGAGNYTTSLSATLGWYVTNTTYTGTNGTAQQFVTPSNIAAPTSSATQLTYAISAISAPSDSNGSTSYTVSLKNGSGTTVLTQSGITTTRTLTYSASAATSGAYTWTVQAILINNNTGASSYSPSLTANYTYYNNNYQSNNPAAVTATSHPTLTTAPTTAGTQLSIVVNSISVPSNSYGSTYYTLTLASSGATVATFNNVVATGTYIYYNASATAQQYTLTAQAVVTGNGSGTSSYPVSINATYGWYQPVTSNVTTYSAVPGSQSGAGANFYTSSSTIAPNSVATEISMSISAISATADSYGTPYYNVFLKNPNHTQLQSWTNVTVGQPIYYYDPSGNAIAGQYQWVVYPTVTPTNTGTSSYNTTLAGTIYWYQNVVNTTYTYTAKDGTISTYSTPSNTAAPTGSGAALVLNLSSVNTPSNSYGTSTLKVALQDPNNNVLSTWPTTGNSITNITSNTFTYFASGATSGSYKWSVWGSAVPSASSSATTYLDSWSGNHTWYQPNNATQSVYIVAKDGQTKRQSANDSDVNFIQLDNTGSKFQVTNSANVPLTFQLGISSSGI